MMIRSKKLTKIESVLTHNDKKVKLVNPFIFRKSKNDKPCLIKENVITDLYNKNHDTPKFIKKK